MLEEMLTEIQATYTAMNLAVKILADILESKGVATGEEMAARFKIIAASLPDSVNSRDKIVQILNRTADGIGGDSPNSAAGNSPGSSIH
jgi:hypothetical protein